MVQASQLLQAGVLGTAALGIFTAGNVLRDSEARQILQAEGANQRFETEDDVVQALIRANRADLAQKLLIESGSQRQPTGFLGSGVLGTGLGGAQLNTGLLILGGLFFLTR